MNDQIQTDKKVKTHPLGTEVMHKKAVVIHGVNLNNNNNNNNGKMEQEKLGKYQNSRVQLGRMWGVKTTVVESVAQLEHTETDDPCGFPWTFRAWDVLSVTRWGPVNLGWVHFFLWCLMSTQSPMEVAPLLLLWILPVYERLSKIWLVPSMW